MMYDDVRPTDFTPADIPLSVEEKMNIPQNETEYWKQQARDQDREFQAIVPKQNGRIFDLQAENDSLYMENERLIEEKTKIEKEVEERGEDIRSSKKQMEANELRIQEMKEYVRAAEEQYEDESEAKKRLQANLKEVRERMNDLKKENASREETIKELEEELTKTTTSLEKARQVPALLNERERLREAAVYLKAQKQNIARFKKLYSGAYDCIHEPGVPDMLVKTREEDADLDSIPAITSISRPSSRTDESPQPRTLDQELGLEIYELSDGEESDYRPGDSNDIVSQPHQTASSTENIEIEAKGDSSTDSHPFQSIMDADGDESTSSSEDSNSDSGETDMSSLDQSTMYSKHERPDDIGRTGHDREQRPMSPGSYEERASSESNLMGSDEGMGENSGDLSFNSDTRSMGCETNDWDIAHVHKRGQIPQNDGAASTSLEYPSKEWSSTASVGVQAHMPDHPDKTIGQPSSQTNSAGIPRQRMTIDQGVQTDSEQERMFFGKSEHPPSQPFYFTVQFIFNMMPSKEWFQDMIKLWRTQSEATDHKTTDHKPVFPSSKTQDPATPSQPDKVEVQPETQSMPMPATNHGACHVESILQCVLSRMLLLVPLALWLLYMWWTDDKYMWSKANEVPRNILQELRTCGGYQPRWIQVVDYEVGKFLKGDRVALG